MSERPVGPLAGDTAACAHVLHSLPATPQWGGPVATGGSLENERTLADPLPAVLARSWGAHPPPSQNGYGFVWCVLNSGHHCYLLVVF